DIPPAPDGREVTGTGQPVRETVTGDVPAPRIYLAHRTYPFGTPDYDVLTVLATILGSGRGSRLYQRLADGARLAQPDLVGAYGVDLAHAPAPVIVTAAARPGVTAEQLEAGLTGVLDEIATGGVTDAELDRAKALLTTAWWRHLSTVDGRADTLGRYATQFGDPAKAADRLPSWLAVTADRVAEVAAEVLAPQDRVTLTYLPREQARPEETTLPPTTISSEETAR
ncbi:M16 family metallopeptidase, partial [Micromonospora echinofusca]